MYADLALRRPSTSEYWAGAGFRDELTEWVTSVVGAPRAMAQIHERPWSTVWRVETGDGLFFAKQNAPGQAFEAALVVELSSLSPQRVIPVTAADPARDLLLTPDQGEVLGDAMAEQDDASYRELLGRVMHAAALLQREVASGTDALVGAGLVRLGPDDVLAYVELRLRDFAEVPDDDPRALSADRASQVREYLPELARAMDAVGSVGLPLTLVHNDLHLWNVFEVDGDLRFFDFGDAMLSDPLAALMVPLSGLADRLECPIADPRVLSAAEPALEVWSDLAPVTDLRAALSGSLRLARLLRSESWARCAGSMTDTELAEYGDAAASWLAAVVD